MRQRTRGHGLRTQGPRPARKAGQVRGTGCGHLPDNDGAEIPDDANAKDALIKDSSGSGYDYILNNQ